MCLIFNIKSSIFLGPSKESCVECFHIYVDVLTHNDVENICQSCPYLLKKESIQSNGQSSSH